MFIYDWRLHLLPMTMIVTSVQAAEYLTIAESQAVLFSQASNFIEEPLKFDEEQRDRIKTASGLRQRWEEQKIWRAEKEGVLQGWFIVDKVIGKHEFITYATAISLDGHVLGIEILNYLETHGGQVREDSWRKHFIGKTIVDPFKLDKDVPNISGATLSCRNVMDGVKRLLTIHQLFLAGS